MLSKFEAKVPSRESRDREIPGSRALFSRSRVSIFWSRSRDFLLLDKFVKFKHFSQIFSKRFQSDAIDLISYVNYRLFWAFGAAFHHFKFKISICINETYFNFGNEGTLKCVFSITTWDVLQSSVANWTYFYS